MWRERRRTDDVFERGQSVRMGKIQSGEGFHSYATMYADGVTELRIAIQLPVSSIQSCTRIHSS